MTCGQCQRTVSAKLTTCPFCLQELASQKSAESLLGKQKGRPPTSAEHALTWAVAIFLLGGLTMASKHLLAAAAHPAPEPSLAHSVEVLSPRDLLKRSQQEEAKLQLGEAGSLARAGLSLEQVNPSLPSLEPELRHQLAGLYERQDDFTRATEQLRWLAENAPGPYRQRLMQLKARRLDALQARWQKRLEDASAALRRKDFEEAGRQARALLQDMDGRSLSQDAMGRSHAILAQVYAAQRDRTEAVRHLEVALEMGVKDPALSRLAREYLHEKKFVITNYQEDRLREASAPLPQELHVDQKISYPQAVPHGDGEAQPAHKHPQPKGPALVQAPPLPPVNVSTAPPRTPPRIVLPSLQVPDTLPRGGGLPGYQNPTRRDDTLPTYRTQNGTTLPGY